MTVFRPIEEDMGDHMPMAEFVESVDQGCFIDYDGFGELATATEVSDMTVCPSDIKNRCDLPPWATHIVWYNK